MTDLFSDAVSKVAGTSREEMVSFSRDVFQSAAWKSKFGYLNENTISSDDKILDSLVRDYHLAKDKELAKQTREKKRALKDKIKIGDSLKTSSIPNEYLGAKKEKSRVEAAQAVSRVQSYPDERRRLLSIVADDFSYAYLQKKFGCSSNTITAVWSWRCTTSRFKIYTSASEPGGVGNPDRFFQIGVIFQDHPAVEVSLLMAMRLQCITGLTL